MFPVYVNFTLHYVNSQNLGVYIDLTSYLCYHYDVTRVWPVLLTTLYFQKTRRLFETRRLIETRRLLEHKPHNPGVY